ncbi:MAG: SlyX family protein, partial [Gammaproteobacteria bacterium]
MKTTEARLIDLEIRTTHQDATLQQLNDVIVAQHKLIANLTLQIEALRQQIASQAQFNLAHPSEE